MKKTILMGLMLSAIASVIGATASTMVPVVNADKGGDPNESDRAQQNAVEREQKKEDRREFYEEVDPKDNDHGKIVSHRNTDNSHGVEPDEDNDCEPPLCTDDGGTGGGP